MAALLQSKNENLGGRKNRAKPASELKDNFRSFAEGKIKTEKFSFSFLKIKLGARNLKNKVKKIFLFCSARAERGNLLGA